MVSLAYRLLAGCMALALVGWGGYRHGVQTADDACTARAAQAAHTADVAARIDAQAESARRLDEAQRMAAASAASREARLKGQINALKSAPRPDCDIPASRLHDYAESVRAANQLDAPERVPERLPAIPRAD